tara:strand:+ start:224 stop:922 length:699 start_codon:yes stop_codon:yes gene_type:complete
MKKLLLFLFCVPIVTIAQQTYVPDDNFENRLIFLGLDTAPLDDYVPTSAIDIVTHLDLAQPFNAGVSDLTGIEDFVSLISLYCEGNDLNSIDLSNNTNLTHLTCQGNDLTTLDLSNNINLEYLVCSENELTLLNLENLNYFNLDINTTSNPALLCIQVSDSLVATNALSPGIDSWSYFSEDCNYVSGVEEFSHNKELLKVTDLLGREVNEKRNTPLFYIYNDGTVEKKIIIE